MPTVKTSPSRASPLSNHADQNCRVEKPMKRSLSLLLSTWALLSPPPIWAQADKAREEAPVHNELRKVRDGIDEAFKKRDFDRLVSFMHPDVVITWQNAEV